MTSNVCSLINTTRIMQTSQGKADPTRSILTKLLNTTNKNQLDLHNSVHNPFNAEMS